MISACAASTSQFNRSALLPFSLLLSWPLQLADVYTTERQNDVGGCLEPHGVACATILHHCIAFMKIDTLGQAKLIISFSSYVQEFPQAGGWLFILFFVMNIIKCHHEFH